MRILLAHTRYRLRGGEDAVYETEAAQLANAGHEVERLEFDNDALDTSTALQRVGAGLATVWSCAAKERVAAALVRLRPEVVHFHNTFPLMSPAVYYACAAAGVPVVQTLHNFRLLCANGIFLRDGVVCESCAGGNFIHGMRHACYRDSRLASGAVALMQYAHHGLGTYRRKVDCYITLTEFGRRKFVAAGLPAERVVVKPNSLADDPGPGRGDGGFALFVGRLSREKGVHTLLKAWRELPQIPLWIAGDGPEMDEMKTVAGALGGNVRLLGALPHGEVLELMAAARLLVVPSECYEGFPMTVVEACSRGLPVVASKIGGLAEIVVDGQTGRHCVPGDARDLARVVTALWTRQDELDLMRTQARARFLASYGAQTNVAALTEIYSRLIAHRPAGSHAARS